MELLIQMRRVEGETYLLDGRNGALLWRQWEGRTGRGFGRCWMTMYDYDADGLEDVLSVYPDMFCVARGLTGERLVADEMRNRNPSVGGGGYWGQAAVTDFLGNGQQQILYANQETVALLSRQGEPIWSTSVPNRVPLLPGIGDDDGDGKTDLFVPGAMHDQKRVLICLEAASGAAKWELMLPNGAWSCPATADIDSDGLDECVFSIDNVL